MPCTCLAHRPDGTQHAHVVHTVQSMCSVRACDALTECTWRPSCAINVTHVSYVLLVCISISCVPGMVTQCAKHELCLRSYQHMSEHTFCTVSSKLTYDINGRQLWLGVK